MSTDDRSTLLSKRLRTFAMDRDWEQFHSPKNLSMALSVEVAEIVEHFQWLTQEQSRNLDEGMREKIAEEIGDVQIYLTRLADELSIDPIAAAFKKIEINERKYPADRVKGKAWKYTEYEP